MNPISATNSLYSTSFKEQTNVHSTLPRNHSLCGASASLELVSNEMENVTFRNCTEIQAQAKDDKESLTSMIREMQFSTIYYDPKNLIPIKIFREINGADLLDGKYDLRQNCINTCIPMFLKLQKKEAIAALGFKVGLSVIFNAGNNARIYFDPRDTNSFTGYIANSYLIFEHLNDDIMLVLDPTVAATLFKVRPAIMTFTDLKNQIRATLEEQHNNPRKRLYPSNRSGGFMPDSSMLAISSYLSKAQTAPTLDEATDLVFNAMYGKNMNPSMCHSESLSPSLPIDQREIASC